MIDETEDIRREMAAEINFNAQARNALVIKYGTENVWDTAQLQERFEVISFLAPFCKVRRKSDGKVGHVVFQDRPRFYFDFQ